MPDVLIRNIPEEVLARVDARAAHLGLSRAEHIRRRLAADASVSSARVSVRDLQSFSDNFVDLADDQVMDTAWR